MGLISRYVCSISDFLIHIFPWPLLPATSGKNSVIWDRTWTFLSPAFSFYDKLFNCILLFRHQWKGKRLEAEKSGNLVRLVLSSSDRSGTVGFVVWFYKVCSRRDISLLLIFRGGNGRGPGRCGLVSIMINMLQNKLNHTFPDSQTRF